jgi:thiol-disulfide isomerase/thioredoxin
MDLSLVAVVVWAVGRFQARDLLPDAVEAPTFSLRDLAGEPWRLEALRGHKVLVHFFAPWCGVCRFEADNWDRVQASHPELRVIAIALGWESPAEVRAFFGDSLPGHPVLLGGEAEQQAWRVSAFPTHYLLDEEGRVLWQASGYTPTVAYWLRLL